MKKKLHICNVKVKQNHNKKGTYKINQCESIPTFDILST
jgi:hypothetical protein